MNPRFRRSKEEITCACNRIDSRLISIIPLRIVLAAGLLGATAIFTLARVVCGSLAFCEPTRELREVAATAIDGVFIAGFILAATRLFWVLITSDKRSWFVSSGEGPIWYLTLAVMSYFFFALTVVDCDSIFITRCAANLSEQHVALVGLVCGWTSFLLPSLWDLLERQKARKG